MMLTIDAVLVAKLLELRLAPGVDQFVSQRGVGVLDALLGGLGLFLGAQICEARVTADGGNEFVAL
jgi:hypothetical protein